MIPFLKNVEINICLEKEKKKKTCNVNSKTNCDCYSVPSRHFQRFP